MLDLNRNTAPHEDVYPHIMDALSLLDEDWEYQVYQGPTENLDGYSLQQVYKLYYSNTGEYTVVFDCQNFLLSEVKFEDFFVDGKIQVTPLANEDWYRTVNLFPGADKVKLFDPLTPWVWKNEDVRGTVRYIEDQLGSLLFFDNVHFFSEYIAVTLYATVVLGKTEQYQMVMGRDIDVHYHHRARNLPDVAHTARVLGGVGVPDDEIERWTTEVVQYVYKSI